MERKDEAIVNLEALRLKGIADEANLNLLGNLHMDRNEPQLALLAYLAAMDKATTLDVPRALKSARILNDYGFPDKAEQFIARIRVKTGDQLPPARPHRAAAGRSARGPGQGRDRPHRARCSTSLLELNPADGEVLLELARHKDLLSRDEQDEEKRAALVAEARTNYQLAARIESVAYPANLALGQMLVRERRYSEALTHLQSRPQPQEERKPRTIPQPRPPRRRPGGG